MTVWCDNNSNSQQMDNEKQREVRKKDEKQTGAKEEHSHLASWCDEESEHTDSNNNHNICWL